MAGIIGMVIIDTKASHHMPWMQEEAFRLRNAINQLYMLEQSRDAFEEMARRSLFTEELLGVKYPLPDRLRHLDQAMNVQKREINLILEDWNQSLEWSLELLPHHEHYCTMRIEYNSKKENSP